MKSGWEEGPINPWSPSLLPWLNDDLNLGFPEPSLTLTTRPYRPQEKQKSLIKQPDHGGKGQSNREEDESRGIKQEVPTSLDFPGEVMVLYRKL